MSLLASGQSLSKSFGARTLFEDISLDVTEGERLGLIGPNGSGKSTLLRILAGQLEPDQGTCTRRKALRVGYLPQEDEFPAGSTVEMVLSRALAEHPLEDYERQTQIGIALGRFEFPDRHAPTEILSGGWRKRLALARELICQPDLLLLDEPTNHLDLEGVLWLEKLLRSAPFAFVLVSHDRYLLENATNRVVELNRAYPGGYFRAAGVYSDFLVKREEFLAAQARQQASLANQVRREVEWLRRGPQARTGKSQSRIDRAAEMMADLAELREQNAQGRRVDIDFGSSGRTANKLLAVADLQMGFAGRQLFNQVSFTLSPGDRLGLIGTNGSGKTTLLRILTGELQPERGAIQRARRLSVVWFDQNRRQIDRSLTLRRALCPQGDTVFFQGSPMHIVAWAKRFLFQTEQLDTLVSKLSGGEQARILIANLMLQPADILLLDEPTNDLDIPSLEVLEESLAQFPGAIVLITHDRYMLDRLSTMVLGLDGRGGAHLFADYQQWLAAQERAEAAAPPPDKPRKPASPAREKPVKLSYREQQELAGMQERIHAAERLVDELQQAAAALAGGDYKQLTATTNELHAAMQAVDALYCRWEALEAKRGD
ncbi:MAG TPA: ABC-F family ATP-binding cassette domain-containing protein [Pirellulales bacterium]|nr:ABC-F family ATP-binding cassette domain-containing protein [Pirellulales bacterium]